MKTIIYRGVRYKVGDWAEYVTTDGSGCVRGYEKKPELYEGVWSGFVSIGKIRLLGFVDNYTDWKDSL